MENLDGGPGLVRNGVVSRVAVVLITVKVRISLIITGPGPPGRAGRRLKELNYRQHDTGSTVQEIPNYIWVRAVWIPHSFLLELADITMAIPATH